MQPVNNPFITPQTRMPEPTPALALGVRCPNKTCRSLQSKVVESRVTGAGESRLRIRRCARCGLEWETNEK